jgi:undecaprenyl-diphosphatase
MTEPSSSSNSRDAAHPGAPGPRSHRPLLQALGLGLMHGPAELLPISSSGHVALVPWLLDPQDKHRDDPELEKTFEVALHAGTVVALLLTQHREAQEVLRAAPWRTTRLLALSFAPPALVGYFLEHPIERYLGTPGSIAAGLIAGSAAMVLADRSPQQRTAPEANTQDAIWLGVAQACALIPGVSRNGATLIAARYRRFKRPDAERLSRYVALPVITAASGLKCARFLQHGLPAGARLPFAVGVGASFASTLASTRLIATVERDAPLWPYAAYRTALGATVLHRLWRGRRGKQHTGA